MDNLSDNQVSVYEEPAQEKIRKFIRIEALFASVILFNVPVFLELLSLSSTNYFTVIYSEFYSLRFPRPLVSSIFFYSFILCLFRLLNKNFFIKKNFILLGIISGLSFTSFFHVFVLEQLILIFVVSLFSNYGNAISDSPSFKMYFGFFYNFFKFFNYQLLTYLLTIFFGKKIKIKNFSFL